MSPSVSIHPSVRISTRNPSTYTSAGPSSPSSACSSCSCSSCEDSSLPLNTPWSTPPTSPPSSSTSTTARRRHKEISVPIVNMNPTPHSRTVKVNELSAPSSSPATRSSSTNGRGYNEYYRDRHIDRRRSSSTSKGYTQAMTTTSSSGRTRFPRKLVSKTAATQLHYPFTTSTDHGGITISTALTQAQIDELIQLTKEIRHNRKNHDESHRHHHREHRHQRSNSTSSSKDREKKAVTFYEKTIVHDVPAAPSPPQSECNDEWNGRREKVLLVPGNNRHHYSREKRTYYIPSLPRFEPLSPPGPSTPKPSSSKVEIHEVEKVSSVRGDGRYRVNVGRNRRGEVVVVRD